MIERGTVSWSTLMSSAFVRKTDPRLGVQLPSQRRRRLMEPIARKGGGMRKGPYAANQSSRSTLSQGEMASTCAAFRKLCPPAW